MKYQRDPESGFTLLELLVALVVLGFVLAGIAGGMQFGQRTANMQARMVASTVDVEAADRILRRLIAEMYPGNENDDPVLSASASAFAFSTDMTSAAEGLGALGEADAALGVDGGHQLVLRWSPSVHAIRLGPPPPLRIAVLLAGVQRVEFAYWGHGPGGGAGQWLSGWTEKDLPPLVRIRLLFEPESHRTWPDIIAATERHRASS